MFDFSILWLMKPLCYAIYGIFVYRFTRFCLKQPSSVDLFNSMLEKNTRYRFINILLLYFICTVCTIFYSLIISGFINYTKIVKLATLTVCISLPMVFGKITWILIKKSDKR